MTGSRKLNKLFPLCILLCAILTEIHGQGTPFRYPPRPPRIYSGALPGTFVTQVDGLGDRVEFGSCDIRYRLIERENSDSSTDSLGFSIDRCSGFISTNTYIDYEVGSQITVRIETFRNFGDREFDGSDDIDIEVIRRSNLPPSLKQRYYIFNITGVTIGTLLATIEGTSREASNELYYFLMADDTGGRLNPWLTDWLIRQSKYDINMTSGELRLKYLLDEKTTFQKFYIGVADGGSPQQFEVSPAIVYIDDGSGAPPEVEEVKLEGQIMANLSTILFYGDDAIGENYMRQQISTLNSVLSQRSNSIMVASRTVRAINSILQIDLYEGRIRTKDIPRDIYQAITDFTAHVPVRGYKNTQFAEEKIVIAVGENGYSFHDKIQFSPLLTYGLKGQLPDFLRYGQTYYGINLPVNDDVHLEFQFKSTLSRVQFIYLDSDRILRGQSDKYLNAPVISAVIVNNSLSNLKSPVTYAITPKYRNATSGTCVFLDEKEGSWSTEGITTTKVEDGTVFCESTHLTSFSILLDPSVSFEQHSGIHHFILSIITNVLLVFSIIALTITLATYSLFKQLRNRSGHIVIHLSAAFLLLSLFFIIVSSSNPSYGWCPFLGGLLHYTVLAAFAWMLIEAKNMHELLIKTFPSTETHAILKRILFGWGIPCIFVCIAWLWNTDAYRGRDYCVITPTNTPTLYYLTYFLPICLALGVNCAVLVQVARILFQQKSNQDSVVQNDPEKKPAVTFAQFKGTVTVASLLGLTWILGVLSIGPLRIVFQYIFCLTTPLQGLVLFVVRVIRCEKALDLWQSFLIDGSRSLRQAQTNRQIPNNLNPIRLYLIKGIQKLRKPSTSGAQKK